MKVGENTNPIYTPTPSEDPSNAYPHYMGTYSDNSPTASTNPADYHWQADPTWLEYSKVNGDQYDSDKSEFYEVIGGKADSEEFQTLKREADALLESYNSFVSEGGKYETGLWYKIWEIPDGFPIPEGIILVAPDENLTCPKWDSELGFWVEDKDSILEDLKNKVESLEEKLIEFMEGSSTR